MMMEVPMTKYLSKFLLVFALCLTILGSMVATAQAQTTVPGATPTPTPLASVLPLTGDQIAFSQLITSDITLTGPFDSNSFLFALPASWRLTTSPRLDLHMAISFNAPPANIAQNSPGEAGTLTLEMNGVLISHTYLFQVGEVAQSFQIPIDAMKSTRTDGLMELRFILDSGFSCTFNENVIVAIHTDSVLTLPHGSVAPKTDLANFPSPIFQSGLTYADSALLVIPDHPSIAELQSALTVAAGLGNLTSGGLVLDTVAMSQLTPQQAINNHLIFIGNASSLSPELQKLRLPMPVIGNQFSDTGGEKDDGIVELIDSPWSVDKAILTVGGNTDAGTVKAAQAISTGAFRTNTFPNLAVVQQVQQTSLNTSIPVDQTLQDLGYATQAPNNLGVNHLNYVFNIPPGQVVGSDAYFQLLYGHSSLLNYSRSGIVVLLNGEPIGSVAFNATTASIASNSAKFAIPPAIAHTGRNTIEVRVNLIPQDVCTQPNLNGNYANIWSGSTLHLPLAAVALLGNSKLDLVKYPAPFNYDTTLGNTALVVPQNDLQTWREAVAVANYLGHVSSGTITLLSAFYGDQMPATAQPKYNFIIIGRASQLPIINKINNMLPAPFASNSDVAIEPKLQVTFRINPNTDLGYVEMIPSPWNNNNEIVVALGNTTQGVHWAASHLIEPLSWSLKGNFAVINNTQVLSSDTRISSIASFSATEVPIGTPVAPSNAPAIQAIPPQVNLNTSNPAYRPGWVLPILAVTILLILITILSVVYVYRTRNRPGKAVKLFGFLSKRDREK
jgi:hypothetical protein